MKHSSVLSTERGGRKYGCREAYSCEQRVYTEFDLATLSPTSATARQHSIRVVVVVVVCFHSLKFRLSSQAKASSCAWCSSEKPPSKQHAPVHNMPHCLGVHSSRRVARRCNPTDVCSCCMVPRLIGTYLACSIGHGAGPFRVGGS